VSAVVRAPAVAQSSAMASQHAPRILVFSGKDAPELAVLQSGLPPGAAVLGIGKTLEDFRAQGLTDAALGEVDVLLNCGVGPNASSRDAIAAVYPLLTSLKWFHSASAGVEHLIGDYMNPAVVLTNAQGVYSHSLAEWTLFAFNWFAKCADRTLTQKAERRWEKFDVQELRGRTCGVVGYGDIGKAIARMALAHGMRVIATKRGSSADGSTQGDGVADAFFPPEALPALASRCDYLAIALPATPHTLKLVDRETIAALPPHAVIVNVGRGSTVDEEALVGALRKRSIKGAGLDVFATEPLPSTSELWDLDNVYLSPHCADQTGTFQQESVQWFCTNLAGFAKEGMSGVHAHRVSLESGY